MENFIEKIVRKRIIEFKWAGWKLFLNNRENVFSATNAASDTVPIFKFYTVCVKYKTNTLACGKYFSINLKISKGKIVHKHRKKNVSIEQLFC